MIPTTRVQKGPSICIIIILLPVYSTSSAGSTGLRSYHERATGTGGSQEEDRKQLSYYDYPRLGTYTLAS